MTNRTKHKLTAAALTVIAAVIAVFFALPFLYMLLMSLHPDSNSIFRWPPKFIPEVFHFSNYAEAFKYINMGSLTLNTVILTGAGIFIGITASVLVAYGFARFRARGSNFFFTLLLSTMMIPWVVTMIPAYAEFDFLGWIGTRLPLIVPWIGGSAFNIFMLKQFIMGIPRSLDEAAEIDGANSLTILFKILLPQLKPVLATLLVFAFINGWSDYVGPSIYLQDSSLHTLSLGMQGFFSATGSANWAYVMAASVLFSLPMVVVLLSAQKAFVRGIVASGIK